MKKRVYTNEDFVRWGKLGGKKSAKKNSERLKAIHKTAKSLAKQKVIPISAS